MTSDGPIHLSDKIDNLYEQREPGILGETYRKRHAEYTGPPRE
jgi:hypothetical protein